MIIRVKRQRQRLPLSLLSAIKPPARLGVSKSFSGVIMKNLTWYNINAATNCKNKISLRKWQMNKQYSDDLHSLSHTKWSCKYHIVFAPKYRRRAFYEARRVEVGAILKIMWMERRKYNRSGSMHRLCTYVSRNTAQI